MIKLIVDWFKNNWFVVSLVLVIVMAFIALQMQQCSSDSLYNKLTQDYKEQAESFDKELRAVERVNKEWHAKQEALNEEHKEKMACIEKDYKKGLESISIRQEKRQTKIVKEARRDPTTLTQRVYEVFGIPIIGKE